MKTRILTECATLLTAILRRAKKAALFICHAFYKISPKRQKEQILGDEVKINPLLADTPSSHIELQQEPTKEDDSEEKEEGKGSFIIEECQAVLLSVDEMDADLKDLLLERLEDIRLDSGEALAITYADFITEIHSFYQHQSEAVQLILRDLESNLSQIAELEGVELIDEDAWNPSLQRASCIDRCLAEGQSPQIINRINLGVKLKGELLRKQEVHLAMEALH